MCQTLPETDGFQLASAGLRIPFLLFTTFPRVLFIASLFLNQRANRLLQQACPQSPQSHLSSCSCTVASTSHLICFASKPLVILLLQGIFLYNTILAKRHVQFRLATQTLLLVSCAVLTKIPKAHVRHALQCLRLVSKAPCAQPSSHPLYIGSHSLHMRANHSKSITTASISRLSYCYSNLLHLTQIHDGKDSRQADITLLGSKIYPSLSG